MLSRSVVRAAQLGFAAELEPAGPVFTRRESIDIGPWLEMLECPPLPGEPLVLDIEAVGVATGHLAAFLVGLGRCTGGVLQLEQHLLADVAGELALLEAVATQVRRSRSDSGALVHRHPGLLEQVGPSDDGEQRRHRAGQALVRSQRTTSSALP